MTRAAIYLRQSLDASGDQLAVTRQREDCAKIAASRGWAVVAEYLDNSVSASDRRKQRHAYNDMITAFERGDFNAIICWDLDRLTRQPRQLEDWIERAEEQALQLVTANGEADLTTDGGRMYARIKAAVARGEIERKGERQRRAALQRAENGRPPLGVRLFGYTTAGDVIADEASIVREAFTRFAAGDSLHGVVTWLNESGMSPRHSDTWPRSTVRRMLLNPRYAGRAVYCGQANGRTGTWAPIVDEDVFDAVSRKLTDPRRRKQFGTDRKYLGSGLFLCGECSAPVHSHSADTERCHRYRCPEGHVVRSGNQVDTYVMDVLRKRLARDDLADLLTPADSDEARGLAEEIASLRARMARTEADYDDDLIDGRRYRTKMERLSAQLDGLISAQARLAGNASLAGLLSASDPVAAFNRAPLGVQRAVCSILCTVRLLPAPRGRRGFDPQTVTVE